MADNEPKVPQGPDPGSRFHDLLSAALGVFAGILLVTLKLHIDEPAADYPFYKGPTIFPIIVLSVMFVSSLPSLYRIIRPLENSRWRLDGYGWPKKPLIVTFMLVAFFLFGITLIGVETSALAFMVLSFLVLGYRRLGVNLVYPILYTVILVILFKYALKIWFPEPLVFSLFGV